MTEGCNREFLGHAFHLTHELHDLLREIIEQPDRWNRHRDAKSGGYQGFGNTGRHCPESALAGNRHLLKGIDDADHRAEQTDERRGGADGGKQAQSFFHRGCGCHDHPADGAIIRFEARGSVAGAGKHLRPRRDDMRDVTVRILLRDRGRRQVTLLGQSFPPSLEETRRFSHGAQQREPLLCSDGE